MEVTEQEWSRLLARIVELENFQAYHSDPKSTIFSPHPSQLINNELILYGDDADPTANLNEGQLRYRTDLFDARLYANATWVSLASETFVTAAVTTHEAASDPHTGYVREADANWVDLTDGGATVLHSHAAAAGILTLAFQQGSIDAAPTPGQLYIYTGTGGNTYTLTSYTSDSFGGVKNFGTGNLTVAVASSGTIDGASSITLAPYDAAMFLGYGGNTVVII